MSTQAEQPVRGIASVLVAVAALGLLLVTWGNALARTGRPGAHALFWIGLVVILLPAACRIASPGASRSERLILIMTTAIALYCVKVVRDPFAFTYADELVHQHNVNEILRTGKLFGTNSILRTNM